MVPVSSIVMLSVNAILGIAVPVCLALFLVRRYHAKASTILLGAGTFIVFALVLEAILHQVVLKGPHGAAIMGNTLWYALYGGLAAGLFEETGRFLAMTFLMKKEPATRIPALAYGVGHGGIEMILIFGLTMISNLLLSVLINTGHSDIIFAQASAEAAAQVQVQLDQLQASSAGTWFIGLWERFSAIILHLGLSLMVWTAVCKRGKWLWLFPAAIALHALVDAGAVILQQSVGVVPLEVIITAEAVAAAAIGYMVTKKGPAISPEK